MFILKNPQGDAVAGFAYKIVTASGQIFRGISNENGETIRLGSGYQGCQFEIYADDGEDTDPNSDDELDSNDDASDPEDFDETNNSENEE